MQRQKMIRVEHVVTLDHEPNARGYKPGDTTMVVSIEAPFVFEEDTSYEGPLSRAVHDVSDYVHGAARELLNSMNTDLVP